MAIINCPYDEFTLKIALLGLDNKMGDDNLANKINARLLEYVIQDKSLINKKIAEQNGITVLDVINSPNYEILKEEFNNNQILGMISILEEESFTNTEAWAIVALGSGNLK